MSSCPGLALANNISSSFPLKNFHLASSKRTSFSHRHIVLVDNSSHRASHPLTISLDFISLIFLCPVYSSCPEHEFTDLGRNFENFNIQTVSIVKIYDYIIERGARETAQELRVHIALHRTWVHSVLKPTSHNPQPSATPAPREPVSLSSSGTCTHMQREHIDAHTP